MASDIEALSLLEFNLRIKKLLASPEVQRCWVIAELSDVAVRGGHCYMELVQKDESNTRILAKCRAVIWANVYARLKYDFETVTGMSLSSGMKLMVEVTANYHEQYGMSLLVSNINPEYTMGGMALKRKEILRRLAQEGIIDMNKQLQWAEVPQRIAVVSAEGAAGYGDFMNQLDNNPMGIMFYTKLFPAVMQGDKTVPSIIAAFDRIYENIDLFDCVVVIRGGGATSELHCFDSYELAATIAQYPVPVIVGIGHERDVTVLDDVAAMRVKTPTAAAEWLISRGEAALAYIAELTNTMVTTARNYVSHAGEQLAYYGSTIPIVAKNKVETANIRLKHYAQTIPVSVKNHVSASRNQLSFLSQSMKQAVEQRLVRENMLLEAMTEKVKLLSPQNTLKRGYSLTLKNGKAVTSAGDTPPGDRIVTKLADGTIASVVEENKN